MNYSAKQALDTRGNDGKMTQPAMKACTQAAAEHCLETGEENCHVELALSLDNQDWQVKGHSW